MAKRRAMTDEERAKAVEIAMDGRDPRVYLEEIGVADPDAMWAYIKQYYKKNTPEVYEKIPKRIGRVAKPETETPTLKVDGPIRIETPEANQVQVAEVPEKPKITKPVNYDGFDVRGVKGEFGTYSYSEFPSGKYLDYDSDGDSLSMTIEKWRGFIAELKRAALVLGVEL
jgi:hypothetical protein